MNAKVAVAVEIVEFCKKRQNELRLGVSLGGGPRVVDNEAIAQFQSIQEAFERVIAAASASQPPPADFKQGEPGIAPCTCWNCRAIRAVGLPK